MIAALLFALAEELYRQGIDAAADARAARPLFAKSAAEYERLWYAGHHNADLAANRAQAYLLADDLPNAIRAAREGLMLSPTNRKLQQVLAASRERVIRPTPVPNVGRMFSRSSIASASILIYSFGWWRLARGRSGGLLLIALGVGGVAFVLSEPTDRRPFVVVSREVTLRQGNAESFPARGEAPLSAGVEAVLLHERGGWLQVELGDGNVGWVPETACVR